MLEEDVSRRHALGRIGVGICGIGTAVGIGYAGTRTAAAVAVEGGDEFLADDVRIERNDGELTAVTVAPEVELRWRDFGQGIERIGVTLSASLAATDDFDVIFDTDTRSDAVSVTGDRLELTDGALTLTVDPHDLTSIGSDVTADAFGGDLAPGESRVRTVELVFRTETVGAQAETVTAVETAAFDVTVHNPEGEATATVEANTDAE